MKDKKELKIQIRKFRDKFKRYQEICHQIWDSKESYSENNTSTKKEGQLREELTEEWGRLEKIFIKIGAPMMTVIPSIGYPTHFFDEALSAQIFENPHKYSGIRDAISSATKAMGLVDALSDAEFKKLHQRTPNLFISYAFRDDNKELINKVKEFVSAFSVSIITGAKPSTISISEKVKNLIDDSDFVLVILTKDEEQKDGGWLPSKWVYDEVAYAMGKGKTIIRLLEKGTTYNSAISGDAEYFSFERQNLTEAFTKLSQILNSLSK